MHYEFSNLTGKNQYKKSLGPLQFHSVGCCEMFKFFSMDDKASQGSKTESQRRKSNSRGISKLGNKW